MEPANKRARRAATNLQLEKFGIHCGRGVPRCWFEAADEDVRIWFVPAPETHADKIFFARLVRLPEDRRFDLVESEYDDQFEALDGAFHPSRAFFFLMTFIVVHCLHGVVVAISNPRLGYPLTGRPPRIVRNNVFYGHCFVPPANFDSFSLRFMPQKEYLKLAHDAFKWTVNGPGFPFRGMDQ